MAVEILSVSLSDDSLEKLAQRVAQLLGNQPSTQSNPPSPETHRTRSDGVSEGRPDPWVGNAPADNGQWPQGGQQQGQQANGPQGGYQGQQQQGYQQGPPPQRENQAPQAPQCMHGEMRFVPAGFSQSSKKAYNAFYGCPAPRGAPDKCKSVSA